MVSLVFYFSVCVIIDRPESKLKAGSERFFFFFSVLLGVFPASVNLLRSCGLYSCFFNPEFKKMYFTIAYDFA